MLSSLTTRETELFIFAMTEFVDFLVFATTKTSSLHIIEEGRVYFLLKRRERIVRLWCPPGLESRFEVPVEMARTWSSFVSVGTLVDWKDEESHFPHHSFKVDLEDVVCGWSGPSFRERSRTHSFINCKAAFS